MARRIISAPASFLHAGVLDAKYGTVAWDPRSPTFERDPVDVDLRACEFIRPPAVLWCAVYPLLVASQGIECRLLVPENFGVYIYLQSLGLFPTLTAAGVEVDERGIGSSPNRQVVLPVSRFYKESEVEELAERTLLELAARGLGAANIHPLVTEVFAEIAINAVQHADSPTALGFIQFYQFQDGNRFVIAVADGGIGIRRSLERNPQLRDDVADDWDAIALALREGVSGTGVSTRGIGLYGVAEEMQAPGRQLIIHSGQGTLHLGSGGDPYANRTMSFPGTLVTATIPT